MKADPLDESPYYLANSKPGNWDSHDYQLQGAGGVPLSERISVVAGAKLRVGTYGRYNDPRPEIQSYQLRLEAGVGYQVGQVNLVLSGIYGYLNDRTSVGYEDIMNRSAGRPEYTVQDIMGYGFYRVVSEGNINLFEDRKMIGFTGTVQFKALNVAYTFAQKDRIYKRQVAETGGALPNTPFGDVNQNEHTLISSYTWQNNNVKRLVGLEAQSVSVKDFNRRIIQGNNYLATHRTATLSYMEQRLAWEFGGSVNFQRVSKKDGTAAVNYLVLTASLRAEASKRIALGANFLQVNGQISYRTDLNSKLSIGSQYNDFMKGVVLPDFTYYSSTLVEPNMSLGYGLKVKNVLLLPVVGVQLQKPISPEQLQGAAYLPRGTTRSYFMQLQVHL